MLNPNEETNVATDALDDRLCVVVFEILYTLLVLNLRGIRHGDPHTGNIFVVGEGARSKSASTAGRADASLRPPATVYVPDHAGAILLSSPGSESDVSWWLESSTRVPPTNFSPSAKVVSALWKAWSRVKNGPAEATGLARFAAVEARELKLPNQEVEFVRFCGELLEDLAREGTAWFVVDGDLDVSARLFDWDWGGFPGPSRKPGANAPFVSSTPGGYSWTTNGMTADPKGDAYLFVSDLLKQIDLMDGAALFHRTVQMAEEFFGPLGSGISDHLSDPQIQREFEMAGAGNDLRYCAGPFEFDPADCALKRTARGCDGEASKIWTPPDCAFAPPEKVLARGKWATAKSAFLDRRTLRMKRQAPSESIEVCDLFADWDVCTPQERDRLAQSLGLQVLSGFV